MGQINLVHALLNQMFDPHFRLPNPGPGRVLVGRLSFSRGNRKRRRVVS